MQRIKQQWQAEAIGYAISLFPPCLQDVFQGQWPHFFVGDSVFSGLQPHQFTDEKNKRPYRETSHVVYASDYYKTVGHTTVVLAEHHADHNFTTATIVHELSHVIHEIMDFEDFKFPNVSDYADTNERENFAEALTAYIIPFGHGYGEAKDKLSRDDYRCMESFMLEEEYSEWQPLWMP